MKKGVSYCWTAQTSPKLRRPDWIFVKTPWTEWGGILWARHDTILPIWFICVYLGLISFSTCSTLRINTNTFRKLPSESYEYEIPPNAMRFGEIIYANFAFERGGIMDPWTRGLKRRTSPIGLSFIVSQENNLKALFQLVGTNSC